MLQRHIIIRRAYTKFCPPKPDISPDWSWRIPMKSMFLAAFAALTLSVAVVPAFASTVAGDAQATRFYQTGAY